MTRAAAPLAKTPGLSQDAREALDRVVLWSSVRVRYKGLHGQGLLRLVGPPEEFADRTQAQEWARAESRAREDLGFVPNGRMLTSRTLDDVVTRFGREQTRASVIFAGDALNMTSSPLTAVTTSFDAALNEGVPLRIPTEGEVLERERTRGPARGLVLHLRSIAPNPFEPRVVAELERQGWIIVTIATQSQVLPPVAREQIARLEALRDKTNARDRALRERLASARGDQAVMSLIIEREELFKDFFVSMRRIVRERTFQVPKQASDAEVEDVGRAIASEVDNSLAGNAYAVEGVLDYIESHRPDLARLPRCVVAFSAGALTACPSIARVRPRFGIDSVVLIGGGADMFHLSQESNLTDGGVRLRSGRDRVPSRVRARIREAYLRHARLDPIKTAASLRGLPVLMLHARWDTWVPASGGDALWEALGRPERWEARAGHLGMFFLLPWKARELGAWIDANTPRLGRGLGGGSGVAIDPDSRIADITGD